MSKRFGWLALASAIAVAGVVGVHTMPRHGGFAAGESEEREGRSPSEGDYWAVHYGYGGNAQRLHFESAWLLDAARQEQKIASAVPAGKKDYRRAPGSPLALNPNAFTLLGPQPLSGEGYG